MKTLIAASLLTACTLLSATADTKALTWQDEPGKYRDLLLDGKPIARYVYEVMDPERREETYKPFHHVYQANGEDFLTKGPGGQFTHHRGIYYGFSKCKVTLEDGSETVVDTWHCRKAYQTHEEFLKQEMDGDSAVQKVKIAWRLDDGTVFAEETRKLTFTPTEMGLQIDFQSTVSTEMEEVVLDGDPQHAGFQFRASNEVHDVTKGQTYYLRPGSGKAKPGKTINAGKGKGDETTMNLPWKAMSVVVGGERYSILYLDHPDNPKPSYYSERDYGRFGSYFVAPVTPEAPVTVNYRLVVTEGEVSAKSVDNAWKVWTGS